MESDADGSEPLNRNKSRFMLVHEVAGNFVLADYTNGVLKVEWNGVVQLNSVREILTTGANLIENNHCTKILLNRAKLEEFTIDSRMWVKNEFLIKKRRLVRKVKKVGTVNAMTAKGTVFANFLTTIIKIIYPNLHIQQFNSEEMAIDWLNK